MERAKNWLHEMERAKNWLHESWKEYIGQGEYAHSEEHISDILNGLSSATVLAEKMANKGNAYHFCKHIPEMFADCGKQDHNSCHEYSHLLSKCGRYVSQRRNSGDHTKDKHEALERIASMKGGESGAEEMAIPFGLIFMAYSGCEQKARKTTTTIPEEEKSMVSCNKRYAEILEKIVS